MENRTQTVGSIQFGPKIDPPGTPQSDLSRAWKGLEAVELAPLLGHFSEIPANDPKIGKYKRFVPVALAFASMSKYPGTRVGCLILGEGYQVLSSGWNGAPRGSDADCDGRLDDKATRLSWACHAEANAIANAARSGTAINGATLICTLMPCMACAKSIVQSGIVRVLCPPYDTNNETWAHEFRLAEALFSEVGVDLVHYDTSGDSE